MMVEKITIDELHTRFRSQGVSARKHIAFVCPICGTVQSMASLLAAGAPTDKVESSIGFSCEGRFNGAGPWPNDPAKQKAREKRGCDWTLGGLFRIHEIEVETDDGKVHPTFVPATAEQAQALERDLTAAKEPA